jgi:hypothetical protein
MRKTDIKKFAKHEAGHAVHFIMNFGERFEFIWIRRTDDEPVPELPGCAPHATKSSGRGGGVFFKPNPTLFTNTHTLVTNCLAGVAGERINRKNPGKFGFVDILMGARNDWEQARRHIKESNEQGLSKWVITNEDRYMDRCFVDAWRQLKSLQAAHEAVTQALIGEGKLTYDEVKAIIYRTQGWNHA